VTLDAEQ